MKSGSVFSGGGVGTDTLCKGIEKSGSHSWADAIANRDTASRHGQGYDYAFVITDSFYAKFTEDQNAENSFRLFPLLYNLAEMKMKQLLQQQRYSAVGSQAQLEPLRVIGTNLLNVQVSGPKDDSYGANAYEDDAVDDAESDVEKFAFERIDAL